jgi:hypothetical protein
LNIPFLIFVSASSKEENKQWAFVGSSSAIELHEKRGAFWRISSVKTDHIEAF